MNFFTAKRGDIRRDAYRRLAKLAVENEPSALLRARSDPFSALLQPTKNRALSQAAISLTEYDTLVALCAATQAEMLFPRHAELLVEKFALYLHELPAQKFLGAVVESLGNVAPWRALGEQVTVALVNLGERFEMQLRVEEVFGAFVERFFKGAHGMSHYLALLGVLRGFAKKAAFFARPQAFKVFEQLDLCVDSVDFLNDVEAYCSMPDAQHQRYADAEFLPILFLEAVAALMAAVCAAEARCEAPLLEALLERKRREYALAGAANEDLANGDLANGDLASGDVLALLCATALAKLDFLDRGETYIVYLTLARLKLGYAAKAHLVLVVGCGVVHRCVDVDAARRIFKSAVGIYDVMLDDPLGARVLQLGSLLVFHDPLVATLLTRAFTLLVANPALGTRHCQTASQSVGTASRALPQDSVVTTLYALTNLVFVGNDGLQLQAQLRRATALQPKEKDEVHARSVASDTTSFNEHEYRKVCENAVTAIGELVAACGDETAAVLAVTLLLQKTLNLNTTAAPYLLQGLTRCAPHLPEKEFVILVKLLHKLLFDAAEAHNAALLELVLLARSDLARALTPRNPLFFVYLEEILTGILLKGDVAVLDHHRLHNEISAIGQKISVYLRALADLLPDVHRGEPPLELAEPRLTNLFRNIWFNMVVHGYSVSSEYAQQYADELERIAYNTPPLALELSWDRTETSLELNTVLKRGLLNHNVKDHRHIIGDVFEVLRTLSYSKLMFLAAALFVESLRVKLGNCHAILQYYSDPSIRTSGIEKYIGPIAYHINKDFVSLIHTGADKQFLLDNIAAELTAMLALCCHGVEDLQDAAIRCCDHLISKVPSALCNHKSLFALFDLLTLLHDSVVDAETNQYEPTFVFTAKKTGLRLNLPDSYKWRTETFNRFNEKARTWVSLVLHRCTFDTKLLIQAYVLDLDSFQSNTIQFGVLFALEMAGAIGALDRELVHVPRVSKSAPNLLPPLVASLAWRSNFITQLMDKFSLYLPEGTRLALADLRTLVESMKAMLAEPNHRVANSDVTDLMSEIAGFCLVQEADAAELVRYLVEIAFASFDAATMEAATGIWGTVMKERPNLYVLILLEIKKHWKLLIQRRQGLFSRENDLVAPEFAKMEYSPSDFKVASKKASAVSRLFQPHLAIVRLLASNFEATMNQSDHLLKMFTHFVKVGLTNLPRASLHPYSRFVRFELVRFAIDVLAYHTKLGSRSTQRLTRLILDGALSWFNGRSSFPFGPNALKTKADYTLLSEVGRLVGAFSTFGTPELELKKTLLLLFLDDELAKISVWLNPAHASEGKRLVATTVGTEHITKAYALDPQLALNLAQRYKLRNLDELLQKLITSNPLPAVRYPEAVQYFIGINAGSNMPSHHLLYWAALSPIDAITLFLPPFGKDPFVLQYTMRLLEHHDVNLTFFYVPQIVQSLRYDSKGYVRRFIVETAQISQLFAHQIIWNMLANSYKDEDSTEPDPLKPTLDAIQKTMLASLSSEDLAFYEKEFGFFNEVTSISGKLKPYIKKSKAEKKLKIDEEMAKIAVQPGVYLPSNPDGVLVDINRKSGRPLQSHAKAPFMATFKIKKDVEDVDEDGKVVMVPIEKWQSAIFKVGDDCRQDVLALQLISVFRTIWLNAGLDLYVFPYRVTATAPGCGVIDVLPNSTSRDMLGREAVNGLYQYYITKFGPESLIEFQQARNNLIRSLAAYLIISYLLQFKDRHNGNIMYDDQGYVLHIDFGFCFDIVPGGVKFEAAPFKLTKEMVMVLGGSENTQAYQWFEELCIRGYLACRPYMETIVRCVNPMLESGLPCFKELTIKKLRKRFVPGKTEKDAAVYFKGLIKKLYESFYTTGYDEFQRLTNGIPY